MQVENFQVRDQTELKAVDPRLEDIVNRMFQRCFEDKKFKQAIGIAIETRRLDVFEKAILTSVSLRITIKEETITNRSCFKMYFFRENLDLKIDNKSLSSNKAYRIINL